MTILALLGCGVAPATEAVYLRVRGEVDPGVSLDGSDAGAVVIWVTVAGGSACVEVDEVSFVPHVFTYEIEITGPPDLDGDPCVPAPADFDHPSAFAVGLLALVDPEAGGRVTITADPSSLLGWFAGEPTALGDLLATEGGRVAAVAEGYALIVSEPEAAISGAYCRFDALIPGLVVYDDRGEGCGGWVPLSAPGERTEIQGIDLVGL